MNLRKGLIAAATALTVSVAGVGVASADTTNDGSSIVSLSADSSLLAETDDEEDTTGSSGLSSNDEDGEEGDDNAAALSSLENFEEIAEILEVVGTAVGAIAAIYGALATIGVL